MVGLYSVFGAACFSGLSLENQLHKLDEDVDSLGTTADSDLRSDTGAEANTDVDGDADADTDADTDADVDNDTDADTDTSTTPLSPSCALPAIYERITHSEPGELFEVAWAPDGSYALILGENDRLYRFEPVTGDLNLVAEGDDEVWYSIAFAFDGSYALIGGGTDLTASQPRLYRYDGATLEEVTSPGLISNTRVMDIAAHPSRAEFAILSDNGHWVPGQITYFHTLIPDFVSGVHDTQYRGGAPSSQNASSVGWGSLLGADIALACDRYVEMFLYNSATGVFENHSHSNTGNLASIHFDPTGEVAWVLGWSGNKVYTWEGQLYTGGADTYAFSGMTIWDWAASADGVWKVFVGREANIYFSDSPWRPIQDQQFVRQQIPSFDQTPWYGDSNTYLLGAAWRPGTCEGLMVGEPAGGQGLLIHFELGTQP